MRQQCPPLLAIASVNVLVQRCLAKNIQVACIIVHVRCKFGTIIKVMKIVVQLGVFGHCNRWRKHLPVEVAENLDLLRAQVVRLDVRLAVGATTESITVEGTAPQLNLEGLPETVDPNWDQNVRNWWQLR